MYVSLDNDGDQSNKDPMGHNLLYFWSVSHWMLPRSYSVKTGIGHSQHRRSRYRFRVEFRSRGAGIAKL